MSRCVHPVLLCVLGLVAHDAFAHATGASYLRIETDKAARLSATSCNRRVIAAWPWCGATSGELFHKGNAARFTGL